MSMAKAKKGARSRRVPANLRLVGDYWHFRIAVPADLRQHYDGRREFTRSTRTGDHPLAQTRALQWSMAIKAEFARLRSRGAATEADITALARRVLAEGLKDLPTPGPGASPEELEEFTEQIDRELDGWGSVLSPHDRFPEAWPREDAAEIVRTSGYTLRDGDPLVDVAALRIAQAKVQVLTIALCRARGDHDTQPWNTDLSDGGRDPRPAPAAYSGRPMSPLIGAIFDQWIAEGEDRLSGKITVDRRTGKASSWTFSATYQSQKLRARVSAPCATMPSSCPRTGARGPPTGD